MTTKIVLWRPWSYDSRNYSYLCNRCLSLLSCDLTWTYIKNNLDMVVNRRYSSVVSKCHSIFYSIYFYYAQNDNGQILFTAYGIHIQNRFSVSLNFVLWYNFYKVCDVKPNRQSNLLIVYLSKSSTEFPLPVCPHQQPYWFISSVKYLSSDFPFMNVWIR